MNRIFAIAALISAGFSSSSGAAVLNSNPGGWETELDFNEVFIPPNADVTNQWSSYGVVFEDLKFLDIGSTNWGGITGGELFEPYGDLGNDPFDVTVSFNKKVKAAGFNIRAGDGPPEDNPRVATLLIEAYNSSALKASYQGDFFGSFSAEPLQYFGFTGFVFDRIEIRMINADLSAPCCGMNLDNLGFSSPGFKPSVVPLPAALPLLAVSLGGLGFIGRRKKKAA